MSIAFRCCLILALLLGMGPVAADAPVRVFAAASLTNALDELGAAWAARGHAAPVLSYAATSALAKQIEAGAPADVFASADRKWMDYLAERGRIVEGSRIDLLGNRLVLIVPKDKPLALRLEPGYDLAGAFQGRLCTGEPDVVPVGVYAKQALQKLGAWEALAARVVGADDVRAALAFVERGECAVGIVYATDAAISTEVAVAATFPADSHDAIVYPFALVEDARPAARAFLDFLASSDAAPVFARHGFAVLPR